MAPSVSLIPGEYPCSQIGVNTWKLQWGLTFVTKFLQLGLQMKLPLSSPCIDCLLIAATKWMMKTAYRRMEASFGAQQGYSSLDEKSRQQE